MIALASALALTAEAFAAPQRQPSERACLIAWNARANHASHLKLLAERPIVGIMLGAGVIGMDTWSSSMSTQTSGPACVMTIMKRGELRTVTGMWKTAGVGSWSFGRAIPVSKNYPPLGAANVRLLSDGRVTKIYR